MARELLLRVKNADKSARKPLNELGDKLAGQYARTGNIAVRDVVAEIYLPLARWQALRFKGSDSLEDLVGAANLGLLKAINRFDPERGTKFSTYAVTSIRGELWRHLRDKTWPYHVERSIKTFVLEVRQKYVELTKRHGLPPTKQELQTALGVSDEQWADVWLAYLSRYPISQDATFETNATDSNPWIDQVDDHLSLIALVAQLPEELRQVVDIWLHCQLSQATIGKKLGIAQSEVSRRLVRARQNLCQLALTS
jgi:RNA polymerase sigma-B factor